MRWLMPILIAVVVLTSPVAGQQGKTEKLQGYAEWRKDHDLVIDGQRVTVDAQTKLKAKGISDVDAIPLGYEVDVKGVRLADGRVLARQLEARPNGSALFEKEVREATDEMEAKWLAEGGVFETDKDGKQRLVGKTIDEGPEVDRARRILTRVTPPYVGASRLRLHLVQTKDWNAMAMGNGAVWIFTGLLNDMDDDEIAIVVGHEVAHYTHEHTRRGFRKAMWNQLILAGVIVAAEQIKDDKKKAAVDLAAVFTVLALQNGYGRNLEDQADRAGLRYAYEGGYNVTKGPALWQRFRDKYGDQNRLLNFFLGNHSVAAARIRNLNREIALNYRRQ